MAPRKARAAAEAKRVAVKKAAENGKVKKAAIPKKLSEPAKKNVKELAVETTPKKVQTPKKLPESAKKNVKEVTAKAPSKKSKSPKKKGSVDAYILFEVCKSCHTYKRNANQIFNDICAQFPEKTFELVINDHGLSRRGSFEVTVSKKRGSLESATSIWSGISKGPPRKLKFPESSALFDGFKAALEL